MIVKINRYSLSLVLISLALSVCDINAGELQIRNSDDFLSRGAHCETEIYSAIANSLRNPPSLGSLRALLMWVNENLPENIRNNFARSGVILASQHSEGLLNNDFTDTKHVASILYGHMYDFDDIPICKLPDGDGSVGEFVEDAIFLAMKDSMQKQPVSNDLRKLDLSDSFHAKKYIFYWLIISHSNIKLDEQGLARVARFDGG